MVARIAFNTPADFKAKPAIKVGRLELVCFQDDLPTSSRSRFRFDGAHQAGAMSLIAQVSRNVEVADEAGSPYHSAGAGGCSLNI